MTKLKHKRSYYILAMTGLLAANLLFFLTIWLCGKYDKLSLDQFLYQMKSSAAGANRSLAGSAVVRIGVFGVAATVLQILGWLLCSGRLIRYFRAKQTYLRFCANRFCRFVSRRAMTLVSVLLLFSMAFFTVRLDLLDYVDAITTDSDFIQRNYQDPDRVKLEFPAQKRNLIYIFLESMEVTYSDPDAGGEIIDNFIPLLTELAEENINFSHTDGVGGAQSFTGTTWTAAAMISQTSGIIVQVPLGSDGYDGDEPFLPGVTALGEILQEAGYNQTLLVGSDAAFAGRNFWFTEHGNYEIIDIHTLKEQGRLPEDYREWWGFEDEKLFAYAKEELTRLSQCDEPFNFTLLTCDSHFPDGYECRLCGSEYEEQYPNVLRCSDRQAAEFVRWIQEQPFYENTTVILSGDHLTMDPDFLADCSENYTRTVYNCILNAPLEPVKEKNRLFGVYDMFPTTLAAIGVTIPGDRMGLGTNLFAARPTLTEQYGHSYLDEEFQKNSDYYNYVFLQMERDE